MSGQGPSDDLADDDLYNYEPLHGQPYDTIRLLYLSPGLKGHPITCTLSTTQLSKHEKYAALSYVWGTSTEDSFIFVDEKRLRIRPNLWGFLDSIRDPVQYMLLWTDAICINQGDITERGHQVRIMGNIYRNACTVFAYLGDDIHNIKGLFGVSKTRQNVPNARPLVPEVYSTPKPRRKFASWSSRRVHNDVASKSTGTQLKSNFLVAASKLVLRNKPHSVLPKHRDAFASLCQRDYWTRMWIVQELLLAQSVILCVGEVQISWMHFTDMVEAWCQDPQSAIPTNVVQKVYLIQAFIQAMENTALSSHRPLSKLMVRYQHQQCLDARDRIYALLALADDGSRIQPDYTKSRLDLFFDLKNIVVDRTVLRRCLDIPVDEIRYRAEMLGLIFRGPNGEICNSGWGYGHLYDITPEDRRGHTYDIEEVQRRYSYDIEPGVQRGHTCDIDPEVQRGYTYEIHPEVQERVRFVAGATSTEDAAAVNELASWSYRRRIIRRIT